jgi:hypothetical protein
MLGNMTRLDVPIPIKVVRLAAAEADVDERTACRVIAGAPTRPACRERVLRALADRGVDVSKLPAPTRIFVHG